jgi:hypothetical protein
MVKLKMNLNSNNLSDIVIPACFWLESSDLRRWMPASAGMTKYSGQQCAEAGIQWPGLKVELKTLNTGFRGYDGE